MYGQYLKSLEWMCDFCVEEEAVGNCETICEICQTASDQPEILKQTCDNPRGLSIVKKETLVK
jgi:hypothetical protein